MNILFFCRLFYPHIGGVEKHIFELSLVLLRLGYKVSVVTELFDRSLPQVQVYRGITIHRIPITSSQKQKKFQIWKWLFFHKDLVKQADIVHCHDVFYWYLPFRFLYPSKKIFTTFHGYEGSSLPTLRAIVIHRLAKFCSLGTINVGDYLAKWYRTAAEYVTYGAVRLSIQRRKIVLRKKKTTHFLFIGRLEKETAIMQYLDIFERLQRRHSYLVLTVIGDGTLRKEAVRFVKKRKIHVDFLGTVTNLKKHLSNCDFIFSPRYLTTLESFAYKKHVFTFFTNAIHRDCFALSPFLNWITLCGTVDEMVETVSYSLSGKDIHNQQIKHAFSWVKQQSWEKLSDQYISLWSD